MKVITDYPPNYGAIKDAIPGVVGKFGVVFTYNGAVYSPHSHILEDHLTEHEKIHVKQQSSMGVEEWWDRYLEDPHFRLEQELQAYRTQFRFALKRYGWNKAQGLLKSIAEDLSGPMYGNIITLREAKHRIMAP